jgi:hypothetical protein
MTSPPRARETEQTWETPMDEEPRKEKGEPTEQLIIHNARALVVGDMPHLFVVYPFIT